jgi:2-keto-4-pentenoate hydratase
MDDKAQAASDLLYAHWMAGTRIDGLPDALRPADEAEGYAIQQRIERRSAEPIFGWKIAATSAAGQAHIQVTGPLAGRLLSERVLDDGGRCVLGTNLMRVAELEFAFRMGETLAPRAKPYSPQEVLDRVETLHPAIEIPDSRFDDFAQVGAAQIAADNACAHYFMLGAASPHEWREIDLAAHEVTGIINDTDIHHGIGRNVLGDPRIALAWLANRLSSLDIPLEAGQVVTTGTCVIPMAIAAGDRIRGDFGILGRVSLSIV